MTMNWPITCGNISKVFLIVLNGFCCLLAICTMIFALVDTQVLQQYVEDQATGTFIGDVIIIAACLFLIAVAAFGTAGAIKGNAKVLYMYIGFLMILVVLEVFIAVYVAVHRFGLQFKVSEWLREDFYYNVADDNSEQHQKLWDQLQIIYECCGLIGPEDYQMLLKPISLSCCPRAYQATTLCAQQHLYRRCIETSTYYTGGCEEKILFVLRSDAEWLVSVALISFWVEAAGMLLAMYVANNVKLQVALYQLPSRF